MKRVIVTGATGFVGANLARKLVSSGHEVHLLVRPSHSHWRIQTILDDLRLHTVEIRDLENMSKIVRRIRPEWVFHLAAYGAYPLQRDICQMMETNTVGTANLLQACLQTGFEAFVNAGTSSEYGPKDHAPSEDEPVNPNSYYAVSKAAATLFATFCARHECVGVCTLRLYSVYGPYEEPTRLIPALILRGLSNTLPPLVKPTTVRDYVYVEDAVDACLLAATAAGKEPGAVYNIGTGLQTSLSEVVDVARRALNIVAEPRWGSLPDRPWDTEVWLADNTRARAALNWRPRYSFADGFRETVDWFRANPAMQRLYQSRLPAR